jgi:hypothetical protein
VKGPSLPYADIITGHFSPDGIPSRRLVQLQASVDQIATFSDPTPIGRVLKHDTPVCETLRQVLDSLYY